MTDSFPFLLYHTNNGIHRWIPNLESFLEVIPYAIHIIAHTLTPYGSVKIIYNPIKTNVESVVVGPQHKTPHPSSKQSMFHILHTLTHRAIDPALGVGWEVATGVLLTCSGSSIALISRKWYRTIRIIAAEPRNTARRYRSSSAIILGLFSGRVYVCRESHVTYSQITRNWEIVSAYLTKYISICHLGVYLPV